MISVASQLVNAASVILSSPATRTKQTLCDLLHLVVEALEIFTIVAASSSEKARAGASLSESLQTAQRHTFASEVGKLLEKKRKREGSLLAQILSSNWFPVPAMTTAG